MAAQRALTTTLVFAMGIGSGFAAPVAAAPGSDEGDTIQRLCLAGFQTAFVQAGQRPPEGMGVFTCRCLVQRLQDGEPFAPAKESCKLEATRRFRVLPKG
jgi:hypothetical protein